MSTSDYVKRRPWHQMLQPPTKQLLVPSVNLPGVNTQTNITTFGITTLHPLSPILISCTILNKGRVGTAHQRKSKPDRSMVGSAHPTKIALLQGVQDVIIPRFNQGQRELYSVTELTGIAQAIPF